MTSEDEEDGRLQYVHAGAAHVPQDERSDERHQREFELQRAVPPQVRPRRLALPVAISTPMATNVA